MCGWWGVHSYGGHVWLLWVACMAVGGACMVAGGHVWLWGVCMVVGACVVVGGVHGCGGCAWLGVCMVDRGHAWLPGGVHRI